MATSTSVDRESLLNAFMDNDTNNTDQTVIEIVNALGGMQNVLTMMLSSSDIHIDEHQMISLHKIITSKQPIQQTDILYTEDNDPLHPELTYNFNTADTYLHVILGDDVGHKAYNIICSRIIVILLAMASFAYSLNFWYPLDWVVSKNIFQEIAAIMLIIWLMAALLTANRKSTTLILQSFEFWFKLLYLVQSCIALLVYWFVLTDSTKWKGYQVDGSYVWNLELFSTCLYSIALIVSYCIVANFDAFRISVLTKTLIAVLFAVVMGFFSVMYTFYWDPVAIEVLNYKILVTSLISGSTQVVCIFSWKQAAMSILKKNRCALIKYSPFIKWKDDQTVSSVSGHANMTIDQEHAHEPGIPELMGYMRERQESDEMAYTSEHSDSD